MRLLGGDIEKKVVGYKKCCWYKAQIFKSLCTINILEKKGKLVFKHSLCISICSDSLSTSHEQLSKFDYKELKEYFTF